jgi:uncharacterized protein (TIGR04255 family)
MARVRHLRNAPIAEAVVDFRLELPGNFEVARFENLKGVLGSDYPNSQRIESFEARLGFDAGRPVSPDPKYRTLGLVFKSADNQSLAQFRSNGFTYNRLEPYTSWQQIFPEAMRLWNRYVELTQPAAVVRLAVRYINRMHFRPSELDRYLVVPPRMPEALPQEMRSFLKRAVIYDERRGLSAIVTDALEPSAVPPNELTVILDIDSYKEVSFVADDPRLAAVFADLHDLKNEIFFESITEEAVRKYE